MPPGENIRVIGAITIRFGTVRPLSAIGRDRIRAAREAGVVTVTWRLLVRAGVDQMVCARAFLQLLKQPPMRCPTFPARRPARVSPDTPEGGTPCHRQGVPPSERTG